MHIGLIGPAMSIGEVRRYIAAEFPDVQITPFSYIQLSELPGQLEGRQHQCDLFLFLGETARRWTASQIRPAVPWYSVPRSAASFLRILTQSLRAGLPMDIVTDFQDPSLIQHALHEAGISEEDCRITYISAGPFTAEGYMERNAHLMAEALRDGRAVFAATIFSVTYRVLREEGLRAYYFLPSFEDIRHIVQELLTSFQLKASEESRIAVIALHIDPDWEPDENSSDYESSLEALRAARYIYEWARRIDAACTVISSSEYLLFSTRRPLEQETSQFTRLDLLRTVEDNTNLTLSAGIGYGTTAAQAKSHARKAVIRALAAGGNCAFFLGDTDTLIGPIRHSGTPDIRGGSEELMAISRRTGISFRRLQILANLCRAQHRTRFTPAELADASGIRQRTMNRLLLKLIDAGCCEEKGRHFAHKSGRPSRIVELRLLPECLKETFPAPPPV